MRLSDTAEPEMACTSKATGGNTAAHVAFVDKISNQINQATQAHTALISQSVI